MNWNDPILFDFYSGNLPRYQQRPGTVLTYKRNPEWFDSRARYHNDPRWDERIRRAVYSGGYGYDPTTGALYNLNKGETTAVPAATQAMSKDRRTWTQQDKGVVQKQISKERAKGEVAKSMQEVFKNPIMYAPGVVGAALFAGPAAAAGLGSALSAPLTIGSTIYPGITMGNILSAGFASDFLLNRAPQIPGQIARGEYGEAALNTGLGVLDLAGANMISPIKQGASALASGAGRFLTTQTPLRNAWRLNPGAVNLERKIAQENIPVRQIFGDEAYENFLKYGPSTRPGVSELEQLKDFIKLPETAVNIGRTGERMELAGLSNKYEVPYFSQGRLWYQGPSKKYMLEQGPERIIVPKNASNLKFNPAGEQDVILEPEKYLPESVDIFAGPRRVLLPSPSKKAYDPEIFDVYEGIPHWWRGYQKAGSNLPSGSFTDYLSTQTPLRNLWKLNPYAYKQQADMMYRGIGQEGFQDAIDAGYLRSKQNVEPSYYKNLNMSKQFGKNTYFSPNVSTAVQYGEGVVAAIPRSSARWVSRYPRQGPNSWSQFTQSQIPTEMVEFYKPHWLKRLTPIDNPVTPKTYPTIWSDLQGMTPTNVGEVLDLPGDLSNDVGLFNYGVFPTKKNPNILVKLENLNRYKELVDPNASIQSGLPELMRDITSPNISKSYMDIDLSNREFLKAIRPDINTVYNNPQIAGRVMSKVQGSPLDALLPSEMENIPTEAYQTFLDDIRMLNKKNIGLDLVGENIMYNPETKRFGMFDLAKLPTESGKSALSLNDLYGVGNTGNISNYRIQQFFQNKMKRALSDVTSANAGEYAPEVYNDVLDKIYENIRKIKKQGGPIVNQRGFMDGAPPKGSNWRIMGDGRGTSITMDLPNMPDEILVVPDGDFDKAKVMKQGQEEYFMGADFVDEYLLGQGGTTGPKIAVRDYPTMKSGGLSANKAREILHHGQVHGHKLTDKQRRFFGAMSKGHTNKFQFGGGTTMDSLRHQANKILQYEQLRGGPGGTPLPGYSDPRYMDMLINNIYPEVRKIMPNASAMEAAEAMDFIFNAGWDQAGNKITKDPRAYALQEYYRQYDPSKLDADGKWSGRKNPAYSFDQEYASTIGKLPENSRRVLMNKGRDWYYKNINNPSPGVPNSNYYDTWYGRIWNTNDFQPFNPNNPKFVPKRQTGGGYGVFGYAPHMQIGGKTDDEKRALAKRVTEIARRRADKDQWVDVPKSIQDAAKRLGEPSNSCIGGVCDVLKEADVIPSVIWTNTEFARLAPSLGFNAANRGWGLKGIENLEPGDVVQYMDPNEKNPNKAIPHHAQIYLGANSKGELEFFDNFRQSIRSYPKEEIEEQLKWTRKPAESQMQIYKINPYNPKPGSVNPEAQKALEEREANLKYQTGYEGNLPEYAYSLRSDSPYYNNPPIGMVKFLDKANDSEFIDDVVKSIDKAGYAKRATREQVHDSLLNVFGILGQENKWDNPWVGGSYGVESLAERIASPSGMSIGPGQIKYSQLSKPIKKAFGINRRQDLQKWDKVIPLMVGLDIANKQWMENQGERFSERIIGQPGLRSDQFKWDEGRMSPYFYRGPGVKNVRKYVESLYGKDWYDKFKPQYMQDAEEMEEDPAKREQFVKENIRQYQKVFDPGSYGQRVFENINKNLQRKIIRKGVTDVEAEPMDAITLREVILNSKRPPRRQLGGNALAMLRDYGGGMSVPQLNSPSPKMKTGGLLSKTVTCSNCGHSWKGIDGGIDPLTCHKCGSMIKMKTGGQPRFQVGKYVKKY